MIVSFVFPVTVPPFGLPARIIDCCLFGIPPLAYMIEPSAALTVRLELPVTFEPSPPAKNCTLPWVYSFACQSRTSEESPATSPLAPYMTKFLSERALSDVPSFPVRVSLLLPLAYGESMSLVATSSFNALLSPEL